VERLVPVYYETNIIGLKISLGVNSNNGQVMAVVWRKFGKVLMK